MFNRLPPTHEFAGGGIDNYLGCAECSFPLQAWASYHPESGSPRPCADCGAQSQDYTNRNYRSIFWVPLSRFQPAARLDESGGLTVLRKDTEVAYYTPGAWITYSSNDP